MWTQHLLSSMRHLCLRSCRAPCQRHKASLHGTRSCACGLATCNAFSEKTAARQGRSHLCRHRLHVRLPPRDHCAGSTTGGNGRRAG